MSYYSDLKRKDIIGWVTRLLKSNTLNLRESDGRFIPNLRVTWDTPWVHCKPSYSMNCNLWKDILFQHIVQLNLPRDKWFAPMGCQDCYKVAVRPKTLQQLFALESLETRLNLPSKAGIELRKEVRGGYGGYFYNRGLPNGLNCYKLVRKEVDNDPDLGPGVKVLLKRGCTEMEHGVGPSDKWAITQEQINIEVIFAQKFVMDSQVLRQSEHEVDAVHKLWIDFAWSHDDPTVDQYVGNEPPYPDYVTYHHLADEKPKQETEGAKND